MNGIANIFFEGGVAEDDVGGTVALVFAGREVGIVDSGTLEDVDVAASRSDAGEPVVVG